MVMRHAACLSANAAGLLTMMMTESPLRNILLTYRSLLIDVLLVFPFPPFDVSVHISFTSSNNLEPGERAKREDADAQKGDD
jgi:hypothetical protein